jgi:serine/threonine-protein kinase RsbW
MLSGVAESVELDRSDHDDIRAAVTEACNNVVLHAYPGAPGPLEVEVFIARAALEVVVRDRGIGFPARLSADDADIGGLGLPMMRALTRALELRDVLGTHTPRRPRRPASTRAGGCRGLRDARRLTGRTDSDDRARGARAWHPATSPERSRRTRALLDRPDLRRPTGGGRARDICARGARREASGPRGRGRAARSPATHRTARGGSGTRRESPAHSATRRHAREPHRRPPRGERRSSRRARAAVARPPLRRCGCSTVGGRWEAGSQLLPLSAVAPALATRWGPSANSSTIFAQNAGRSSGLRLDTRP